MLLVNRLKTVQNVTTESSSLSERRVDECVNLSGNLAKSMRKSYVVLN
jgi:hypothetical protein